jgi:uncharacterized protein DUF6496
LIAAGAPRTPSRDGVAGSENRWIVSLGQEDFMAQRRKRKYSRAAGREVESEMRRFNRGTARSGKGGKAGKVKSRKQAIAIALSKARKKGERVPKRK